MFTDLPVDALVKIAVCSFRNASTNAGMRLTATCKDMRAIRSLIDGHIVIVKDATSLYTVAFVDSVATHADFPAVVQPRFPRTIHPSIVLAGNYTGIETDRPMAIEVWGRLRKLFLSMFSHTGYVDDDECIATVCTKNVRSGEVRTEHLTTPRYVYVDPQHFRMLCESITNQWFGRCFIRFNTIIALRNNTRVSTVAEVEAVYLKEYERGPRDNNEFEEVVKFYKCKILSVKLLGV